MAASTRCICPDPLDGIQVADCMIHGWSKKVLEQRDAEDLRQTDIPRADVQAVLGQIRSLAGSAVEGTVHHAYAGCALMLERLLGEEPGTPGFQRIGGGS